MTDNICRAIYRDMECVMPIHPEQDHHHHFEPRMKIPHAENRSHDPRGETLVESVKWCRTCRHTHIPEIPLFTFECLTQCGFGAWSLKTAQTHVAGWPDHQVYIKMHRMEPLPELTAKQKKFLSRLSVANAAWLLEHLYPAQEVTVIRNDVDMVFHGASLLAAVLEYLKEGSK